MPVVLLSIHPHSRGSFIPLLVVYVSPGIMGMLTLESLFLKPVHLHDNDLSVPTGVVHASLGPLSVCSQDRGLHNPVVVLPASPL